MYHYTDILRFTLAHFDIYLKTYHQFSKSYVMTFLTFLDADRLNLPADFATVIMISKMERIYFSVKLRAAVVYRTYVRLHAVQYHLL